MQCKTSLIKMMWMFSYNRNYSHEQNYSDKEKKKRQITLRQLKKLRRKHPLIKRDLGGKNYYLVKLDL